MTTDLVTVTISDTVHTAARKIIDNRFPVHPARDGQFNGIIRANDLINALNEATTKTLFKQTGLSMW